MKNVQDMIAAIQNLHMRLQAVETVVKSHDKAVKEMLSELENIRNREPSEIKMRGGEEADLVDGEEYVD